MNCKLIEFFVFCVLQDKNRIINNKAEMIVCVCVYFNIY